MHVLRGSWSKRGAASGAIADLTCAGAQLQQRKQEAMHGTPRPDPLVAKLHRLIDQMRGIGYQRWSRSKRNRQCRDCVGSTHSCSPSHASDEAECSMGLSIVTPDQPRPPNGTTHGHTSSPSSPNPPDCGFAETVSDTLATTGPLTDLETVQKGQDSTSDWKGDAQPLQVNFSFQYIMYCTLFLRREGGQDRS